MEGIQRRFITRLAMAVALILLVPALAMQFTTEVTWGPEDFLAAGLLLFFGGLMAGFILHKVRRKGYRMLLILLLVALIALIWLELAVGVFGSPFGGK